MPKHPGMPYIIYAELNDQSRNKLKAALGELKIPNTLKDDQSMHHVTLAFNPSPEEYGIIASEVVNQNNAIIQCKKRVWSESFGIECVTVEIFNNNGKEIYVKNKNPHITVAANNKPPVESNTLLENKYKIKDYQEEDLSYLFLTGLVISKD